MDFFHLLIFGVTVDGSHLPITLFHHFHHIDWFPGQSIDWTKATQWRGLMALLDHQMALNIQIPSRSLASSRHGWTAEKIRSFSPIFPECMYIKSHKWNRNGSQGKRETGIKRFILMRMSDRDGFESWDGSVADTCTYLQILPGNRKAFYSSFSTKDCVRRLVGPSKIIFCSESEITWNHKPRYNE